MKQFFELLFRRTKSRNYIDLPFYALNFLVVCGGSVLWLVEVDPSGLDQIFIAATLGIAAEMPLFYAYRFMHPHVTNRGIWAYVVPASVIAINSLIFETIFYALSPAIYISQYYGFWLSWANQTLAVYYLMVIYAFVRGSFKEYKEVATELDLVVKKVRNFEESSEQQIIEEGMRLRDRARESLMPTIQSIQEELAKQGAVALAIAEKIEDALRNKVKPLSRELRRVMAMENISPTFEVPKISPWGSVPRTFNPRNTFNATFSAWALAPLILLSTLTITNRESFIFEFVEILTFWIALQILRFLLTDRKINRWLAVLQQQAVLWCGLVLASYVGFSLNPENDSLSTFLVQLGPLASPLTAIYTYIALTEISLYNANRGISEIKRRLTTAQEVMSQKIWIAKRNWSYLIHGRVQSRLLAAQIIARQGQLATADIRAIGAHFDDVLETLNYPPKPDVDLRAEIDDLEGTWNGIAKLDFNFSNEVLAALERSPGSRFAVNEILKEAVSNAIKHAHAKNVWLKVFLDDGSLCIEARNNGDKPNREIRGSLGSEMLDELTSDWDLDYDEAADEVLLYARLALTDN